jgi:hypothetical protein
VFATCVAEHVTISLRLPAPSLVQLQAQLQIIVPTNQQRRMVARLHLNAAFGPSLDDESEPLIEYRLAHVELVDDWQSVLLPWARFLMEQRQFEHENDNWPSMYNESNMEGRNFRDVFVQQSHTVLQSSAMGMQSAWNEVQAATGLKNKLPAFLPRNVLQQAQEEEQSTQQALQHRPTSILGGFVRKGWTQLAKSVALPEEDETLYQAWQPPPFSRQQSSPSRIPSSSGLQLYRHEDGPPITAQAKTSPQNPFQQNTSTAINRTNSHESKNASPPSFALYRKVDDEGHSNSSPVQGRASDSPTIQQRSGLQLYRLSNEPQTDSIVYQRDDPLLSVTNRTEYGAPSEVVPDGWDDDEVAIDDDDSHGNVTNVMPDPHSFVANGKVDRYGFVIADWKYDPVTDIRPTRKRWVNPFPGPRRLQP